MRVKGSVAFVLGFRVGAPGAPLHAANTLGADQIGPRASHARRFLSTVEIHQHLALGTFPADSVVGVDQDLTKSI